MNDQNASVGTDGTPLTGKITEFRGRKSRTWVISDTEEIRTFARQWAINFLKR